MRKMRLFLVCLIGFSYSHLANAFEQLKVVATEHKLLQYQDGNKVKGPSAEIFNLLMAQAGLDENVEFYPWSRAYKIAETRPNTIILSMVRTKEREDKFIWLIKISSLVRAFISLKSTPQHFVTSIEQAKSKLVVVVRDSYGHRSLLKNGFSNEDNLYAVASHQEAINLFEQGKVDLIYTDPNVIKNYYASLNLEGDEFINYVLLPETRRDGYIAINRKSDPKLVTKLQQSAFQVEKLENYQQLLKFKPLIDQK